MYEYWITADMDLLPVETQISIRRTDRQNKIGVRVYLNGKSVALTGDAKADVVLPDGTAIEVAGDAEGNKAWVVLPAEAYKHTGTVGIYLKLMNGAEETTLIRVELRPPESL